MMRRERELERKFIGFFQFRGSKLTASEGTAGSCSGAVFPRGSGIGASVKSKC